MKKVLSLSLALVLMLALALTLVSCGGGLSGEYEIASTSSFVKSNVTKFNFEGDKVTMTCDDDKTVTATFEIKDDTLKYIVFTFESDDDAKTAGYKTGEQNLFSEDKDHIMINTVKYNKK